MKSAPALPFIALLFPLLLFGAEKEPNSLSFSFNRGLDFYRWGSKTAKMFSLAGEHFQGEGDFYVMLRQPPGFPNQWKTSLDFSALWSRLIRQGIELQGGIDTDYFHDRQVSQRPPFLFSDPYPSNPSYIPPSPGLTTGLDNRIYRQSTYFGVNLKKFADISIKPSAGIYGEKVMESTAVGPTGKLALEWGNLNIGGYDTDFSASGSGQFMRGRTHRNIEVNFRAGKDYSHVSSNIFSAKYRNYIREFPVSNSLTDRRRENEYRLSNTLKYNIFGPLAAKLDLKLGRRRVEPTSFDDTNRLEELSTGLDAGFEGEFGKHVFKFGFGSEGHNQTYPQRKIIGRQYKLTTGADFLIGEDSLKFTGMISRLKYDVSPEYYSIDTHDELRHSYILRHFHPLSQKLDLETQLRTDLYHLVYLKSGRSGDNNWERFFLFSPTVRYQSVGWSQFARFTVSADYIDYDFQQSAGSSRVFRKFSAEDSLRIKLTEKWALKIRYLLLLEDQGGLDWGAFVQDLSDEYRTHDGCFMLVWDIRKLEYRFGWAYYQRRGYHIDIEGKLKAGEKVESSGPLFAVYGDGPWGFKIELSASYKRVTETNKNPYPLTTIDLTMFKLL